MPNDASTRFCPTGNHFRKLQYFRVSTNGRTARDCHDCENARKMGHKQTFGGNIIAKEQDGVDIDAIHFNPRWRKAANLRAKRGA